MRIGVNAHLLPHGPGYRSAGVAVYVQQLVSRLPRVAPQHEYTFFAPPESVGPGVMPSRLPTSQPIARILWEQAIEPVMVHRRRIDIMHSPVNISPLISPAPSVVTIHDLSFLHFPDSFKYAKQKYLMAFVRRSVRGAARVITPSHATKRDVTAAFGVSGDVISVIPEGVDEAYRPQRDVGRPLPGPYILYAGTIEPRKNLPMLLKAFAELKSFGYPHTLALVGGRGWKYSAVDESIASLEISQAVVMPGFEIDLVPWYNHADLFVYPSLYEGFGLPPLEAMACGTPVVVSSAGSLSEVAGDAALMVAPTDTGSLVTAMRSILDDMTLRERLIAAGLIRSALFSWDETVKRTVETYESAVDEVDLRMNAIG